MSTYEQNFSLIREAAGVAKLTPTPVPKLPDDYILVKTKAVALNPTDWSTLDNPGNGGTVVGCDYSGVIEEVGPAVRRSFRRGDRVAGFGHGGTIMQRHAC
jgi:NADPH:quinone reductase-like Zn-dependent oxidoreductase